MAETELFIKEVGIKVVGGRWDGMIVKITPEYVQLSEIPGRTPKEEKIIEYGDALIMNDALRQIFPGKVRP